MYIYDPFQHCCPTMNEYLDSETIDNGELLEYSPDVRKYCFILHEDGKRDGTYLPLLYCPWCGRKLPEDLSEEMEEVLEKEYGITSKNWDSPEWNDDSHLPSEFKTDEWWKNRNIPQQQITEENNCPKKIPNFFKGDIKKDISRHRRIYV